MRKGIYILLFQCFAVVGISAQEISFNGDPDAAYFAARELAFAGNHLSARDTLEQILERYPDYTDVRSLLAKTYSWDANYDEARKHLNRITSIERGNKEAWLAAIKNEIYAQNTHIALGLTNKALIYLPEDSELLAMKAELTGKLDKVGSADPANKETTESKSFTNQIAIYNAFDVFDIVYDPMIYSGLEYTRETDAGKIIPKVNYANRFDTHGLQYEMDFYPELSKTFYGYLNYGFSDSSIFPKHRLGVEIYANLPKSMEASLGMRYLDFLDQQTTILTGSYGLYKGNYFASLRGYLTPTENGSPGLSGTFTGRKYLKSKDQYLGFLLSVGFIPELRQLTANNTLLAETLFFVESQQIILEYQFPGNNVANLFKAQLGLTHQELVFEPGTFFWAVTGGFKYHVRF